MNKSIVYLLDFNQSDSTKEILGLHLNAHNVFLVPISVKDLFLVTKKECPTIICIINSMNAAKELKRLKNKFFKYALLNKKINLIEVESGRACDPLFEKMRNYHQYHLPMSYLKLADSIIKSMREFLKVNMSWPGGKRSRVSIKSLM